MWAAGGPWEWVLTSRFRDGPPAESVDRFRAEAAQAKGPIVVPRWQALAPAEAVPFAT